MMKEVFFFFKVFHRTHKNLSLFSLLQLQDHFVHCLSRSAKGLLITFWQASSLHIMYVWHVRTGIKANGACWFRLSSAIRGENPAFLYYQLTIYYSWAFDKWRLLLQSIRARVFQTFRHCSNKNGNAAKGNARWVTAAPSRCLEGAAPSSCKWRIHSASWFI